MKGGFLLVLSFITTHFLEIIFGLISAGALAFCKYMYGQLKKYKELLEKEEDTELENEIESHIKPINERIDSLMQQIQNLQENEKNHIDLIIASYRFRLIQLCKDCIKQGHITQEQYDQLTEFYKIYHALGGNGQAQEYYETAIGLDIRADK